MGRVPMVFGPLSLRPLASPVTTRILILLEQDEYHLQLTHKIIFFCLGNQGLYLVIFQFLERRYSPYALYELLELLFTYLGIYHIVYKLYTALARERRAPCLFQSIDHQFCYFTRLVRQFRYVFHLFPLLYFI